MNKYKNKYLNIKWAFWNTEKVSSLIYYSRGSWFKASWRDGPWPRQSWPVNRGTQPSPSTVSVSSVLPRLPSTFTSRTPGGLCWNSTTLKRWKPTNQLTSHKLLNQNQSVSVRSWMRSVQGCIVDINPYTVARSLLSLLCLMWRHTLEILLKMYWFYWLQHIPGLNVNN